MIPPAVDAALEWSVAGSFTRVGPAVRRRLQRWEPPARLDGRVVAVTGATSGIGEAAAQQFAELGAHVVLLVRDARRGATLQASLERRGAAATTLVSVDMSDLESVRAAAARLRTLGRLDVLVHNAGALSARRETAKRGIELTLAVHVVGPLLLTALCLPLLRAAAPSRVVVVTSGGMYTEPVPAHAVAESQPYSGSRTYARAKRIQVTLVEECRPLLEPLGVHLVAMHPGWSDTPGLRTSLPAFRTVMRPLLRSPAAGAETAVWLAGAPPARLRDGALWLDRAPRPLHRAARTRRTDTAAARRRLLAECRALAGIGDAACG